MQRDHPPKVSALIITYNQERYIEQAVRSVLDQQTDFDFEIMIGEDCSTDGTRAICQRLADEHPTKIRLIAREKNVGMVLNHRLTHFAARGQYIASLEGDDYWIDPRKLQKQADFLDAHPQCVLCFHNVIVYDRESNDEWLYVPENWPQITGLREILRESHINTSSLMMRGGVLDRVAERDENPLMADWPFYIALAALGDFGYIDEVMACYRHHAGGTWMNVPVDRQIEIVRAMYDVADRTLGGAHRELIESLKERFASIAAVEGARRTWKQRAIVAEKRIEELERGRRRAKLRQRADIHPRAGEPRPLSS